MNSVLITGAGGFIGSALCAKILAEGWQACGTLRSESDVSRLPDGVEAVSIASIDSDTKWDDALAGIDTVVHLAARVHVMDDSSSDPLTEYRKINVEGTKCLAIASANTGVKRFVYISSIKVNGEGKAAAYTEDDEVAPQDPYGVSKWEAEQELHKISAKTGIETVILRPPLVYGPGVKANFLRLVNLVKFRIPLPLGCIKNRRSLIYIANLVDAIITCMTNPNAAGKTYLVSDGEDVSTPELIRRIGAAFRRRALLLPVPVRIMRLAGRITGKYDEVERLVGSLTVDISKIRKELEWKPPYTMEHGLRETAKWYAKKCLKI
ncbi:MAG: SDR family oxidoreductase [Deltaproteobacteria bacterium]|nr:SDR family oxidoreductase [Deltaproteobacteria bacterium]